jgi:cobalt-zinc-cadmium resistance protein CzcA
MKTKSEIFFNKIIEVRWYVCFLFGFIALFGFYSIKEIKIDAIPDITNKQVIVNTKTFGMEPLKIEKAVTYPIESQLYGIYGLIEMRSVSKFGLSQVILVFDDDVDIHFARNQVLQRISAIGDQIPSELKPQIAPLTTGIGEIILYRVFNKDDSNDLMELRTVQQFEIARELKKVNGVAEVDTIGGFERELHLNINSQKILSYGLTPQKLIEKIQTIGENFGGGYIERNGDQKIVRTFSNIKSFDDVMNMAVKIDYNGKALPLKHVVEVRQEHSQRLGIGSYNGKEAVIGTVMLQSGDNAKEVLLNVNKAIQKWNNDNKDVKIEILYSRQFLIDSTIKTVTKNLFEGILLVIGVLFLLLGNLRLGLIVALCLPFCIFILAICMKIFGISANLMSLGAIDFGLLVDSSVVLVEYIVANLVFSRNLEEKKEKIAKLSSQVFGPLLLGIVIIAIVYVPILMFSGIEGKTFKPMAINVIIAILASIFVAFILMPILAFFFIKENVHHQNIFFEKVKSNYIKILDLSLRKKTQTIIFCAILFIFSLIVFFFMSSDFLPDLNEGDIVYTITAPDRTSLSKTGEIISTLESKITNEKEVAKVFSRIGISQAGLDLMPQNSADVFVILKDEYKRSAKKIGSNLYIKIKDDFLKDCLNCDISELQPIKMRFNEMLEGSRADLSLKVFGDDLNSLILISSKIEDLLSKDSQVKSVKQDFINSIRKGFFVNIVPNYEKIARYQVTISDLNNDFKNSMIGVKVGNFYETAFPIGIVLHLNEVSRNNIDSISNMPISVNDGGSFSLKNISQLQESEDITSIPRFFGKRYSSISLYLKNTNYEEFITKAEKIIVKNNILPDGYGIEWSGRFKNFNNAKRQIIAVIPILILLIGLMLFKVFGNPYKVLIIFSSIPFGLSGGIFLLALCQIPITISVYIGFIALIGISLLNSIILINTFKINFDIRATCISRLRPILMTATVASLGFLPMAFGDGIGAEVQQPMAITVIGGIISSTISTLILSPILIDKFIINKKIPLCSRPVNFFQSC